MGEAKQRERLREIGATKPCHVTAREQLHVAALLIRRKNSSADTRRNIRVFAELGIESLVEQLIDSAEIKTAEWASPDPILVRLTGDTVDHLIKALDIEMEGPPAFILHGLLTRLRQVDADTYSPPEQR